jgi:hypothetical protein
MSRLSLYVIALFVTAIVVGIVFLANWNIPAPAQGIEKVIDNGRFPK